MKKILIIAVFVTLLVGCNQAEARLTTENSVAKAINSQIEETTEKTTLAVKENNTDSKSKYNNIDIDLTEMNSDMVYATVYQFMTDPDSYIGKTVKMQGTYYSAYYEETDKIYHYIIISDAMACCSQGLEFNLEDDSYIYPELESNAEVTGIFETYTEEGSDVLYCRLKNAELKVV